MRSRVALVISLIVLIVLRVEVHADRAHELATQATGGSTTTPTTAQTNPAATPQAAAVEVRTIRIGGKVRALSLAGAFAVLWALLAVLHAPLTRLVVGEDHRYSKSKFQVALWFVTVIACYLAAFALRWWASDWTIVGGLAIPSALLALSGMSAFSFVGAKQVTLSKIAQNPAVLAQKAPDGRVPVFPDDLVTDDNGQPDLGDTQMVVITIVAVATYLVSVYSWLATIPLTSQAQMPNVDTTLLAMFGLGQGTYLVKKQISS